MVGALLLGALVETLGLGQRPLACSFPGTTRGEENIEVVMTPRPSLKDMPGLFRVEMAVNGALKLTAAAQPITATEARDVMVSASAGADAYSAVYTVGIDQAGHAALSVFVRRGEETPSEATRTGHCRNYRRHLEKWSAR